MIFSKNSSSFGSDSDFEEIEPNQIILGSGNNQMTLRIKPAMSTDKTSPLHNMTQDKTMMISPDLLDDK